MKERMTPAWQLYEAGKEYKRRIGLYETVRQNERFYRGDQWHGSSSELPHPVFNVIKRTTDHLVCSEISPFAIPTTSFPFWKAPPNGAK